MRKYSFPDQLAFPGWTFLFIMILTERRVNPPAKVSCEMAIRRKRSSLPVRRPSPSTMTAGFG